MHFILDHRVERNIGRVKEQVSCPPSLHSGGEWEEKCVTRRQVLGLRQGLGSGEAGDTWSYASWARQSSGGHRATKGLEIHPVLNPHLDMAWERI